MNAMELKNNQLSIDIIFSDQLLKYYYFLQ